MERKPHKISVRPESDVALLIRRATAEGETLVVDTGTGVYRVDVTPATPDDLEGAPSGSDEPIMARRKRLAAQLAGSLADRDIPGWESSDAAVRWVRDSRKADMYPLDSKHVHDRR